MINSHPANSFIVVITLALLSAIPATGSEIYVPDDYATIQEAIDATVDGDRVIVRPGTYAEIIDFPHRDIEVSSLDGAESTIIDGRVKFYSSSTRSTVLDGFTIRNGVPGYPGVWVESCSPTISNNIIQGHSGSGITVNYDECSPLILDNVVRDNTTNYLGGGLSTYMSQPVIVGNSFINNRCINEDPFTGGGAICVGWYFSDLTIVGNEFIGNSAAAWGGAILCVWPPSSVVLTDNTFVGNSAHEGGVIYCTEPYSGGSPVDGLVPMVFGNNLFDGNSADYGSVMANGFFFDAQFHNCTFTNNSGSYMLAGAKTIVNSIIWNNSSALTGDPDVTWSIVEGGWPGEGNIDADPLFVNGPGGNHYLSQTAAGQAVDSPGLNGGANLAEQACFQVYQDQVCMDQFTTRTDLDPDEDQVDMGYHYPLSPPPASPYIAAGLGPHPSNPTLVHLLPPLQDATPLPEFSAYSVSKYGLNVACSDVTGTGADTILTGPGPGAVFGPHVRGFSSDGIQLPGLSFLAYGTNRYGVNVAAGDLDGDGFDEIITGAGPGEVFGPHVRAFDYDGGPAVTPMPGVSFMAYGTSKWGVNVTAGDLDADGYDEIVTGAGPGPVFGAHVRGWNVDGGTTATPMAGISYFAYETPRYGVVVGCGDVDGDGMDEIITAPGPSPAFGTRVRGWNYDGTALAELPGLDFFAWPAEYVRYGATVWAGTDLDLDGRDEIIVGGGPDPGTGSTVKVFDYQDQQVTLDFTIDAFPPVYTHGVNVAAGRF